MGKSRKGFTLIELLIVVVIIAILAALLLPALIKSLCQGRAAAASSLVSQLSQACKSYELDFAVYPPGKGVGSKDLQTYLSKKGAKQLAYFEFNDDMLESPPGPSSIVNPVFGREGDPPSNVIHYRNNVSGTTASNRPAPGTTGPGGAPYMHVNSFDMWCAGCDFTGNPAPPTSMYSIKYE